MISSTCTRKPPGSSFSRYQVIVSPRTLRAVYEQTHPRAAVICFRSGRGFFRLDNRAVLRLQALPQTETMYEPRPPLNHRRLALLSLLLRSGVFGLPICLPPCVNERPGMCKRVADFTSSTASSFSAATTMPVMTGSARPFLNSKLVCGTKLLPHVTNELPHVSGPVHVPPPPQI
jgi:hypothetical protein